MHSIAETKRNHKIVNILDKKIAVFAIRRVYLPVFLAEVVEVQMTSYQVLVANQFQESVVDCSMVVVAVEALPIRNSKKISNN